MKMAVEEINAAGGIQGRKIRLIVEDSGYDPKRAVLDTQKLIEKDQVFSMVGAMGSPTVLAAQDIVLDAGVTQLFPLTSAQFTFKMDPGKPQERLKFANLLPYVEIDPGGAQIHGGMEALEETLHHASGRRVREKRARRLHASSLRR